MSSNEVISALNQRHIVNADSTLNSELKQSWIWVDTKSNFIDNLQCLWNYDNHILMQKRQPEGWNNVDKHK